MLIRWEDLEIRRGVRIRNVEVEADSMDEAATLFLDRLMPRGSAFTSTDRTTLRKTLLEECHVVKDKIPPSFIKYDVYIA